MRHTEQEIETVIAVAKKHGVRRLCVEGIEVELPDPPPQRPAPAEPGKLPESLVPRCGCGHPKYDHREIGCIHGCDPRRCIPNPPPVKED